MIDNATIERAKKAVNIVDLAAKYGDVRKEGAQFKMCCLFHDERTPSLSLDPNRNLWHCFGACNIGGNTIQFLMKVEKLTFDAAVTRLLEMGNGSTSTPRPNLDAQKERQLEKRVDDNFKRFGKAKELPLDTWMPYVRGLFASEAGAQAFLDRGIRMETLQQHKVGFVSDARKFVHPDREDAAPWRDKPWAGFGYCYGNRVRLVKWRPIEWKAKAFVRISDMADVLYIDGDPDPLEDVLLVEGELDALTLWQNGYRAASLPSGSQSKVNGEMKDWLLGFRRVYLCVDNDEAGKLCLRKMMALLPADRTRVVNIPPELKDANGLYKACEWKDSTFKALMENLLEKAEKPSTIFFQSLDEAFDAYQARIRDKADEEKFWEFPWPEVDRQAVVSPGELMVIASTRSKVGKTGFTTQACMYNAKYLKRRIGYYTAEMDVVNELIPMITAQLVRHDRDDLTVDDIDEARAHYSGAEFYFGYDPTAQNWEAVRDLCVMAIKRLALDVMVVDHLDFIIRDPDFRRETSAKNLAMREIAQDIGKKYGALMVILRQMNKSTALDQKKKGNAEPDPYDIPGGSASITDAHHVFILNRRLVKNPGEGTNDPLENDTRVSCLTRHKGKGAAISSLIFRGAFARFDRPGGEAPISRPNLDAGKDQNQRLPYGDEG